MPKVSVVIPAYNYGRFAGEAIQSVLDQTFKDFELLVVDDGSTDNTREVVNGFKDNRINYIYQKNRGVPAARNSGILATNGEYIAFLDADDLWLPQFLELEVEVLDSQPEVGIVCSDFYVFDDRRGVTIRSSWHDKWSHGRINPQKARQNALRYLLSRATFISLSMTMFRRDMFTEVGYFDETLKRGGEDWDIFVRISRRFPIGTIDIPLGGRRQHGANITENWENIYESKLVVLDKAVRSYSLSNDEQRIAKRRIARTYMYYGYELLVSGRITSGRAKLLTSISVNPWCVRPFIYLAGSYMGRTLILIVKSWKGWLKRHLSLQPSL
jgi:glycosyltransferase involved in cell wall biosynthesis